MIGAAAYPAHVRYDVEVSREPGSEARRALRTQVREALAGGRRHIVIDCQACLELDLPLLSVLVQCATECEARGAEFEIANLPSRIRASIEALRLDQRLGLRH